MTKEIVSTRSVSCSCPRCGTSTYIGLSDPPAPLTMGTCTKCASLALVQTDLYREHHYQVYWVQPLLNLQEVEVFELVQD